jgi:hypothetical protein
LGCGLLDNCAKLPLHCLIRQFPMSFSPPLSLWQIDSVGMFLVALVIIGKNSFEPSSLFFSKPIIDRIWLVIDHELFAATVTPNGAHFLQTHCFLTALTILNRNCTHLRNVSCDDDWNI